jgi:hypothetical protein
MIYPDFVGNQTPEFFGEHDAVYFLERYFSKGIQTALRRVPLKATKAYRNIEDILCDVELIPLETSSKTYTVDDLKRHIATDALVPFPKVYDEYSIVAHAGIAQSDRPIAMVNHPDGVRFYAHPDIAKFIKRIPV